jgi:hypothetical protein
LANLFRKGSAAPCPARRSPWRRSRRPCGCAFGHASVAQHGFERAAEILENRAGESESFGSVFKLQGIDKLPVNQLGRENHAFSFETPAAASADRMFATSFRLTSLTAAKLSPSSFALVRMVEGCRLSAPVARWSDAPLAASARCRLLSASVQRRLLINRLITCLAPTTTGLLKRAGLLPVPLAASLSLRRSHPRPVASPSSRVSRARPEWPSRRPASTANFEMRGFDGTSQRVRTAHWR